MSNDISYNKDTEEKKKNYDAYCKKILANKYVLANLLKYSFKEFRDFRIPEIVACIESQIMIGKEEGMPSEIVGLNVEDSTIEEGKIIHDILFQTGIPNRKDSMFVNIEIQNNLHLEYPLINREYYYIARMQSRQQRIYKGKVYKNLKKSASIWIHPNVKGEKEATITRIRPTEYVEIGEKTYSEEELDKEEIVYMVLDRENENPAIRMCDMLIGKSKVDAKTREKILKEEYEIKLTSDEKEEMNEMCDMGDAIYEYGFENGVERGVGIGKPQGIKIGKESERMENIRNVMDSLQIGVEQAMQILKITEVEKYKSLLHGR